MILTERIQEEAQGFREGPLVGAGVVELQARQRCKEDTAVPLVHSGWIERTKAGSVLVFVGLESLQPPTPWLPSSFSLPGAGV